MIPNVTPLPPAAGPVNAHGLEAIASRFPVASDELLASRSLLRRTDAKFLVPAHRAVWVLASVTGDYHILPGPTRCLARYQTIYFDTPELHCFHEHRRGRRPRHKIRIRRYPDRGEAFFEIKTKLPNRQTKKHRLAHPLDDLALSAEAQQLVSTQTALSPRALVPTMEIGYWRMTLLGEHNEERLTIDVGLDFDGARPTENLDNVVLIEVKQPSLQRQTPIMRALRVHRLRPGQASKYCVALAMARKTLPRHFLRPFLRTLERMQQ